MFSLIVAPETNAALAPIEVAEARAGKVDRQANWVVPQVDALVRQQRHQSRDYVLIVDAEVIILKRISQLPTPVHPGTESAKAALGSNCEGALDQVRQAAP